MSVYIKGMEMPKSCSVCPMLEGDGMDGLCHAASKWLDDDEHWTWYVYPEGDMDDSKPRNCPLVFVPPHYDLIDHNALKIAVMDCDAETRIDFLKHAMDCINKAPVVIPSNMPTYEAEEGE